jgi:hypothetical protein
MDLDTSNQTERSTSRMRYNTSLVNTLVRGDRFAQALTLREEIVFSDNCFLWDSVDVTIGKPTLLCHTLNVCEIPF